MNANEGLAARFEQNRTHLRAVAYRMLGSVNEADDAVQEAWLRLSRSDTSDVENLSGWLTTVVGRVCLDMLRSRKSRREEPLELHEADEIDATGVDPEAEALKADSVGLALLVVLETLAPAERLAFVLHDLFAVSFEEIAPIVGRTPAAARKLASRARARVQGAAPQRAAATAPRNAGTAPRTAGTAPRTSGPARQRAVVEAFLSASRGGDLGALLALLDPDAVLRADGAAVAMGAEPEIRGAARVAENLSGRAKAARVALVDGVPGAVWMQGGRLRVVFAFTVAGGKVLAIDLLSDPDRLGRMAVSFEV